MIETRLLVQGVKTVEIIVDGVSQPPVPDYDSLSPGDKAAMLSRFARYADGHKMTRQQYKPVEGQEGLFEFKKHQHRFLGFHMPGQRFVIAAYEKKQQDQLDRNTIKRAKKIRMEMKETPFVSNRGRR